MRNLNRALIVEDSEEIVEAVTLALQIRWPSAEITSADKGREALEILKKENPDIIILDLGLPDINGFEVLKCLRSFCDIPVVILTVKGDEADIVKGLELGANDYIVKPFRQMEFVSRVYAQFREKSDFGKGQHMVAGRLSLDLSKRTASIDGRLVYLTPIESSILAMLMRNCGQVVTHETLANEVWGVAYPDSTKSLKVHIHRLREKIEAERSAPQLIQTKACDGYYLNKSNLNSPVPPEIAGY